MARLRPILQHPHDAAEAVVSFDWSAVESQIDKICQRDDIDLEP